MKILMYRKRLMTLEHQKQPHKNSKLRNLSSDLLGNLVSALLGNLLSFPARESVILTCSGICYPYQLARPARHHKPTLVGTKPDQLSTLSPTSSGTLTVDSNTGLELIMTIQLNLINWLRNEYTQTEVFLKKHKFAPRVPIIL
ncbi:hypothetical protein F511_23468 [Dorcoceras hygrometricum]|uniref:Uncharacterized protein n=1 Tax=Dorcoceras hygrometricum TaxID=472368 RepID=A0A2Z7BXN2_9LAMI|nr:hypothetical protein F511_23468 [Dorcoceras hygrometricum]